MRATFPQLLEELGWRHKKWVLLQHTAQNHHWVGAQNVHRDAGAKLGAVIRSYDRIFVLRQDKIQPCLIFNQVIDTREVFQRPLHVSD